MVTQLNELMRPRDTLESRFIAQIQGRLVVESTLQALFL